jgi:seryl-tRNA synthetase
MSVGTQRLRDDADRLRAGAIAKREDPAVVDAALAADASRRELSVKVDALRAERKNISAEVGALLAAGTAKDDAKVIAGKAASQKIADQLTQLEDQLATAEAALEDALLRIRPTKIFRLAVRRRTAASAPGRRRGTLESLQTGVRQQRRQHQNTTQWPNGSASST